mmetsp:Transcript_11866/g.21169  ORF Transcript_11866/g.21169 Transcript_11866/m.21169 type:complete len:324 (+) Transcript_11866:116-1087(+)
MAWRAGALLARGMARGSARSGRAHGAKIAASAALGMGLGAGALLAQGPANCEPIDPRADAEAEARSALSKLDSMISTMTARVFVAPYVDHTLLSASATVEEVQRLCHEAASFGFQAVCVNGCNVKVAKEALEQIGFAERVKVCAVVGFPLGAASTSVKAFEAAQAIEDGAVEVDMVLNVGRVKSQDWDYVLRDLAAVVSVCKEKNAVCKVILETCLLNDEEKAAVCKISALVGADFVKTSTGFSTGGATIDDVKLMHGNVRTLTEVVPIDEANVKQVQVKASGGIKTAEEAVEMLRNGATRIGTSRAANWCSGSEAQKSDPAY